MKIVLFVSLAFTCVCAYENSDDFINEINKKQNFWRAGRNFAENTTLANIRVLLGSKPLPESIRKTIPVKYHEVETDELPQSFDARTKWPKCKTIKQIADQSNCGSCWAVSVASSMSDRICIYSDGRLQPEVSARNLMACDAYSGGCMGGNSYDAWFYWKRNGIVTGGAWGSKIGCQPYSFAPCEHHISGPKPACPSGKYDTPKCVQSCDNSSINYKNDLIYGASSYQLSKEEKQIRAEIFKYGPVVASFAVYNDFIHYKSGVYSRTSGSMEGLHAVRVIGWGEENGHKYWLVANSWNEDWGDKGLFKIRRGVDECGIESEVTAGLPR